MKEGVGIASATGRAQYGWIKLRLFLLPSAIWFLSGTAVAAPTHSPPKKGELHEITLTRDSVEQSSDGTPQGSSHDQDSIVERVLAIKADGVELEYDLPSNANADERSSQWQLPVRVLRLPDGQLRLLNSGELEARVGRWLKAAGWPRTVCGHWIFTWNGFKIECDPQSVLKSVEAFDLTSIDVGDGTAYRDGDALESQRLTRKVSPHGHVFSAELQVNPDVIRHARAETDVAVGEVTNKPTTLHAALKKHANDQVAGTISVTVETDQSDTPFRRTKVTKLLSKEANGTSKTQTITEVLERKAISTR